MHGWLNLQPDFYIRLYNHRLYTLQRKTKKQHDFSCRFPNRKNLIFFPRPGMGCLGGAPGGSVLREWL